MTQGQGIVSVVLPVRNGVATIVTAVTSVLVPEVDEVVVVDDGSSDGTVEALRSIRDSRLNVISSAASGLVPALNEGLRVASGDWIARMDADDVSNPRRFLEQRRMMHDCDIIGCGVRIVGGGAGYALYASWLNALVTHEAIMRERFIESPLAHPSVLMRRTTLEALGGYRDMGWAEDYDLWLRAAQAGARFGKTTDVLLDWTDRPERTSRRDGRYSAEAFLTCKAHHLARGPLTVSKRCTIWGAGPVGSRLGRALRQNGIVIDRFVDIDSRKIGSVRGGTPIVAPEALSVAADSPVLAAVAARGARELVREQLVARGFVEGTSFWCVA